jgi:hypothetical protein
MVLAVTVLAQRSIGMMGGYMIFDGLGSASARALSEGQGYMFSGCYTEGEVGELGVRGALSYVRRSVNLSAKANQSERWEELRLMNDFIMLSFDVRAPLGAKGVYLDIGPEFGAEVLEHRQGVTYYQGYGAAQADTMRLDDAVEERLRIRDIRLRIGISGDVPLKGKLSLLFGMHHLPGWTVWAREHGYSQIELRGSIGLAYRL